MPSGLCFSFRLCDSHERNSGGYSVGVPPLPIPNREVKPDRADGTAKVGEKVAAVLCEGPLRRNPERTFFFIHSI